MHVSGIFAGIGGFELGFRSSGHSTVFLCENDPAAIAVTRSQFLGVKLTDDVSNVESLPKCTDVLAAGFPCQNLSMAGDKSGIDGAESTLVAHLFRILEHRKVPWVVLENVYFMLHLAKGKAIRDISAALEALGYRWAYRVVNSYWFGVPQRRRRVFFVACLEGDPRQVLLSDDVALPALEEASLEKPIGFYWTEGRSGVGTAVDSVPPLKTASGVGIPSPPAVLFPDGFVGMPEIREAERLQGFPPNWTKAAEGVGGRGNRWRLVGNAVTVPVARWIGQRLSSPKPYDDSHDEATDEKEKCPNAAWNLGKGRFRSHVGERPLDLGVPSLSEFKVFDWEPLSKRATAGFVKRADEGKLRFPDGFKKALRSHLDSLT